MEANREGCHQKSTNHELWEGYEAQCEAADRVVKESAFIYRAQDPENRRYRDE